MKSFTDLFIKRPVLASVMSMLIIVFGVASLLRLPLRELPDVDFFLELTANRVLDVLVETSKLSVDHRPHIAADGVLDLPPHRVR